MSYCKVCGKKLELTPEYDMCMGCQGKQHRTFTIPNNRGSVSNKTEMTPKEALDRIAILSEILVDVSKFHIMPNDGINEIRKLDVAEIYFLLREQIKELEELKRNVKRYFELEGNYQKSSHEYHEMKYIKNKLMEAGAKDV